MIELKNLTKSYATPKGRHYVFKNLNAVLPENKSVALLGKNGAGKSTLLRVIGGIDYPDEGQVITNKTISWPVALSGGFQGSLTARQNVRFVARLYVASEEEVEYVVRFVEEFAEIGKYFDMPMKSYSSGMRSRIGFGLSMAFNFDYYLLDEVGAVGDRSFRKKSQKLLDDLKQNSNIIMVSHNVKDLIRNCDVAFLVRDGKAEYFDNMQDAIEVYKEYVQ
ncbi:ABC transporter ATP-binding protein [Acinetobacter lwoffii]|uniref:ABC transporter ATP-binding protein n=1 Tax=Acinetobacter lwoffii TaxID=28090 RepID=A0AAW8AV73_ACILW|nr:ABC transporter ATP-binding protein [Acinetobacter lwoffii]MDP1370047.1 ABC transporter ATP-binding protein [Acinetobacter lwoffii]MDP1389498.1 ABC transporter ATP-binding protein [Acinetobacter lwoffii]MDP1447139.1 ABC transporter ATP-binding protein [Acinetobacter lwoffii]